MAFQLAAEGYQFYSQEAQDFAAVSVRAVVSALNLEPFVSLASFLSIKCARWMPRSCTIWAYELQREQSAALLGAAHLAELGHDADDG